MHLFLSHQSCSKQRVRRIAQGLPPHVSWWLDQDEMPPGSVFPRHIEDAIAQKCDFLIAFLDVRALDSEWVRREVALGLRREADLQRTFVIPVLLQDVRARLQELDLAERLYLPGWEEDDDARLALALSAQLFALASRIIEGLRGLGRRGMLDAFAAELTAWKQAAFQWRASLGNSIAVLTTNQAAFDHVRESVAAYNRVADVFIPHLALHRDRITAAWASYRGLCEDTRELVGRVEQVYRGEMYRLNEIHELVHAALVAPPDAGAVAAADVRRSAILAEAGAALDQLSERATRLLAALEREIA